MRVRKILAGIRINRMGQMREMPKVWSMKTTATTEKWGDNEVMGGDENTDREEDKEVNRKKGEGDGGDEDKDNDENENER